MSINWLWDRKTSANSVKKILRNPGNKIFLEYASLLLSRNNSTREVFTKYLNPIDFCRNWQKIKRVMRRDIWNNPRIEFWQAIYEKLIEKYSKKKIRIHSLKKQAEPADELCKAAGNKIKNIRKQNGLTQKQLAGKMKISQQLISRIEKGRENISVITLKKVASALNSKIFLDIKQGGSAVGKSQQAGRRNERM